LDINLPQGSGLDAVPLIRKFSPGSKIIAVSMHSQPAYAKKMLQLGAKGYVTKNSSPQEMLTAIDDVMNNKTYICLEIKNNLSEQFLQNDFRPQHVNSLSLREIEVVKLLKEGRSSKEIASLLEITPRTVEVHRYNILRKLGLKNTAALISFINGSDLPL
jgi:DNA-binding NarL/FixJ family response regulator